MSDSFGLSRVVAASCPADCRPQCRVVQPFGYIFQTTRRDREATGTRRYYDRRVPSANSMATGPLAFVRSPAGMQHHDDSGCGVSTRYET